MKKTKLLTVVDGTEGGWVKNLKMLTVVDVGEGREGHDRFGCCRNMCMVPYTVDTFCVLLC